MQFDITLKDRVEALALQYYDTSIKEPDNIKKLNRIADTLIKASEAYCCRHANISGEYKDDLVQEIRIAIHKAAKSFNPGKGKFLTWVIWYVRQALNKETNTDVIRQPNYFRDMVRKYDSIRRNWENQTGEEISDEDAIMIMQVSPQTFHKVKDFYQIRHVSELNENTTTDTGNLDRFLYLRTGIQSLPETHRDVILLHYFEGLSIEEVGERLDIPSAKVQRMIRAARKTLRRILDEGEENIPPGHTRPSKASREGPET